MQFVSTASDYDSWLRFFQNAQIPGQFASTYAKKFSDNRIRFDMLNDLDKPLLNEMGIVAVGDCLSILKYAKTVHEKLSISEAKSDPQEHSPSSSSKKNLAAKRILDRLITDSSSDTKSNSNTKSNSSEKNSNLSSNLLNRLNFKSSNNDDDDNIANRTSSSPAKQQVVKFNKDSLLSDRSAKVVVSSTTNDEEASNSPNKKLISLKRKSAHDQEPKPLDYVGLLKNDSNKEANFSLSLSAQIKQLSSKETRANENHLNTSTTTNTACKLVKQIKNDQAEKQQQSMSVAASKNSVFNRIKKVATANNSTNLPLDEEKQTQASATTGSKIISLKKPKSIHDRLSFN